MGGGGGGGGLYAFYWRQIFALDSVVVRTQKWTYYDETKKRAHDSQAIKSHLKVHMINRILH